MKTDDRKIEVYEWKPGAARPATTSRASDNVLALLQAPPDGKLPGIGDSIALGEDPESLSRYKVVDARVSLSSSRRAT